MNWHFEIRRSQVCVLSMYINLVQKGYSLKNYLFPKTAKSAHLVCKLMTEKGPGRLIQDLQCYINRMWNMGGDLVQVCQD